MRKAVKLVTWNIQHGGGTRLARIVEEIAAYDPDVVAVTEFRAGPREWLYPCRFRSDSKYPNQGR